MASRTLEELDSQRLFDSGLSSKRPQARLQFGIGGLLNALGPIGQLINAVYGEYLQQIQRMVIILTVRDLLDANVPQTIRINGVLSGAALLGPYAYNYANSYIDIEGISLNQAASADVFLIGGAAVAALGDLFGSIQPPAGAISIDKIFEYFDKLIRAIDATQLAFDLAYQLPDHVIRNSFSENFGCLPSLSDNCIEMRYDQGFRNVSGGSVSFTVLMLVRTTGPRPSTGFIVLPFAPNT